MTGNKQLANEVKAFCARAGSDSLTVQAAGGNVSWKDCGTLWIKASGTWLADAASKDIFVPVDLSQLSQAIEDGNFGAMPQTHEGTLLKPSIETMLHALMPQTVVAHVHMIDPLTCMVQKDCDALLANLIGGEIDYAVVAYQKPGADLAQAVAAVLEHQHQTDLVFLKNHGVLVGGATVADVEKKLAQLEQKLYCPVRIAPRSKSHLADLNVGEAGGIQDGYMAIADADLHQLASEPALFKRLSADWVLYPDHVVFLGPRAFTFASAEKFQAFLQSGKSSPDLVFVEHRGVFVKPGFSRAKQAQLRCYYDVLVRLKDTAQLVPLKDGEIADLLNWDAEKYRQSLNM